MPHVIGTAGHIDHGKTALIRALTGQETDRLKEERERGISIDIGFAYLDLDTGERVGIVDVPGHERFIRNMLAGAHGIDLVLLVVAADDGVMPQTEEHLDIVHLLGATHAVVAITKSDLVDTARIAAVREEIDILLAGTRLEGAPVVPVSAVTGAGLATLRGAIEGQLRSYDRRPLAGHFRLPVDRAFVMHGHGTVVTGTAVAGSVRPNDIVRVLPGGEEVRIRSVQVHGHEVDCAAYGQRVALNLAGIERADVGRGHVVCALPLRRVTDRLDAWVELRPAAGRRLRNHDPVRLYLGTAERIGKLVFRDARAQLEPHAGAYAQLILREPLHALRGDRFILRNQSAQRTIGGGVVVYPFAFHYRRGGDTGGAQLERLHHARDDREAVGAALQLDPAFLVAADDLAEALNLDTARVRAAVAGDTTLRALPHARAPVAYTTAVKWTAMRTVLTEALRQQHAVQPLSAGIEMESMRTQFAADVPPKLFRILIDALVEDGTFGRSDSVIRLASHRVTLDRDQARIAARAEELIAAGGLTPPDLKLVEAALGLSGPRLHGILQQLEREGRVTRVGSDLYYAPASLERARELLRAYVRQHGEITAAAFRDLLGASRKFSISLLDYFDRTGFTLRVGDVRKLRRDA